jgi:predicted amidohydrolase YtcJ
VLKDEAIGLVGRHVPAPSAAERDEALRRAQVHALERGVTMIEDMGSWSDLETYRRARTAGALQLRVYAFVPLSSWKRLQEFVEENGRGDEILRWGGVKGFVDGSLGSTTAWFHQPYEDSPGTTGLMVTDTAELRAQISAADAAGLQVVVHAIGDLANDWLLQAYADVAMANGPRDRRFRIEHAQHLSPAAIARFAAQSVIPSMQPYHAIDDGRWAEKRIGAERIRTTYAFRSLLDAGARLAFGSDWTVAPLDPILGIYAAVTRQTIDDANPGGWVPGEKIGVEEALRGYTSGAAYGAFQEELLGTLEPGMAADLVVLSGNIIGMAGPAIRDVKVDHTVVAGKVVYTRHGG